MITRPVNFFGKLSDRGELESLTTVDERSIARKTTSCYSATAEAWLRVWKIGQCISLRIRCVGEYTTC